MITDHDLLRLQDHFDGINNFVWMTWPARSADIIERLERLVTLAEDGVALSRQLVAKYKGPMLSKLLATGGQDWIQARLARDLPSVKEYRKRSRPRGRK